MRQIRLWAGKHRTKAWFALGVNLLVLIGIFLLMMPFYETNDDLTISEFINGSYAIRDAHLVFQNYLLGLAYKLFYFLPGRLPWYAFFQYGVLWLSFSAVTYVLLQRLESAAGYCVSGILLIYFAYEGYVKMQFSKVAGIATAAGLFLLFYAVTREKLSVRALLAGWALGCIGSMYRFDEFLACAALMTGIGVFLLLRISADAAGKEWKRILRYLGVFAGMFVLAMVLRLFDHYMYESDPLWDAYNEYNDARYELMDYGLPSYEENRAFFEQYDINEDAYELYCNWNIYDPDKFTVEVMRELAKLREEKVLDAQLVTSFIEKIPVGFFGLYVFYGVLILLALWLVWGDHTGSALATMLYETALFMTLYFYLYYTGRYLVNRVDVGLFFAFALVVTWLISGRKMRISYQSCGLLCLGLFLLNQNVWRNDWRFDSANSIYVRTNERAILESIAQDKEHLYLAKINTVSGGNSYGPFNRMASGVLSNICWLGGWEANTAGFLDTLHRYGVENPYRDMIGNESVYLIDNDIDLTLRYLHAYYDKDAQATLVKELAGGYYKVYQIGGGE